VQVSARPPGGCSHHGHTISVHTGSQPGTSGADTPWPYNALALVPAGVAKKILDLKFIERGDIVAEDDSLTSSCSTPPLPTSPKWLEQYSIMAAILTSRFPELLAYLANIVRREALARKDLNWSTPSSRWYNFTRQARATLSRVTAWSMTIQPCHAHPSLASPRHEMHPAP